MTEKRIEFIDTLRGISVVLMVIHHFLFDAVSFLGAPKWLFTNPVFNILHYIFAGLFILLSGVSSNFSRNNIKRGIKAFAVAMVFSVVTWVINMPIMFGVLHLLSVCMILYGLIKKYVEKIDNWILPAICILLTAVTGYITSNTIVESKYLWIFGFKYNGFYSADYFPLLPWIFVFFLGTYVGKYIKEGKFPKWFYSVKSNIFSRVGRKALIIYVVHQPILFVITYIISWIIGLPIKLF